MKMSVKGKVRIGLIGLGTIGKVHLHNSLKLNGAEPFAVSEASKQKLEIAKTLGVRKLYKNYHDLLDDPEVDAVIISLPNFLHCECAVKAAEAKKDIFLEKPLARNVDEGRQTVSKARREGVKLMVGYPLRFSKQFS